MPIYEFLCADCNRIFSFFSRTVNTTKIPACPRCSRPLLRQMSIFAKLSSSEKARAEDEGPSLDETRMERALAALEGEMDHIDENDPRGAARLMRKLSEEAGLPLGEAVEEALSRLERGEDPDRIDEEMGDALAEEEPFLLEGKTRAGRRRPAPSRDETLYDL